MAEPEVAPAAALQPWRERLLAAKVLMRYDYAWKDVEFQQAEHRITGIGCRIMYLHAVWVATYNARHPDAAASPRTKVFLDSNGFSIFSEQLAAACALMDYHVVDDALSADLVFVYVAPPNDQLSVASQFKTFERVTTQHEPREPDQQPLFCFLLGDADFLPLPKTDEDERLRGLSGFAISQHMVPVMQQAAYGTVAQFAVEFVPPQSTSAEFEAEKHAKLDALMDKFGCVGQNLMHHTEKWEVYAPSESVFCHDDEDPTGVTHPSEEDSLFWFQEAKGKTCDQCYKPTDKLSRCARCQDVLYCSRECQKAAWRLHKQLCGKTPEQIRASNED